MWITTINFSNQRQYKEKVNLYFLFFILNNYSMIKRLTVYAASSKLTDEKYITDVRNLAKILIDNNITVVYGGGEVGLMGELANYMLEHKGKIEGVIPKFMVKVEWAHPKVKKMTVVKNMHERKKLLIKNADAIIALPGGTGTLEELMEVISLKRLGIFIKPIVILNTNGFYNPLIELFDKMISENFLREEHRTLWTVIDRPDDLFNAIENSQTWDKNAINLAQV